MNPVKRFVVLWTSVAAIVVAAGGVLVVGRLGLGDRGEHAASHILVALPAMLLMAAALKVWPPPHPATASRSARRALVAGLLILTIGNALEAVGAYGYEGNTEVSSLARAHAMAIPIGVVGVLLTAFGAVASILTNLAARYGGRDERWLRYAIGVGVAAAALFVLGGLIFGY